MWPEQDRKSRIESRLKRQKILPLYHLKWPVVDLDRTKQQAVSLSMRRILPSSITTRYREKVALVLRNRVATTSFTDPISHELIFLMVTLTGWRHQILVMLDDFRATLTQVLGQLCPAARNITGAMKAWHDCVMIPKEYQIYNNRDGLILS